MAGKIDAKLAEIKGQVEADLTKVNQMITGNAKSLVALQAKKAELEATLAEFTANYPAIVAKAPITVKPGILGKVTP